jgi:hypothetical protein
MDKIRKTDTKEVVRFKKWLSPEEESPLLSVFNYEKDRVFLKKLIKGVKHIAFIKSIIKFLAAHKDSEVPQIIFDFSRHRYTKGYRSSLLLLLEKYDYTPYIYDILDLFVKDSYNTTWYAYDLLIKYLRKIDIHDLEKISKIISIHIKKEKDEDKKEYHELFLKKVNAEIKKRVKQNL